MATKRRQHEQMIKSWYGSNDLAEWDRLRRDAYQELEETVTSHFLHKYLPNDCANDPAKKLPKKERGLILDAGCGPGRYSVHLAKAGYDLELLDLVPEMLALARAKAKAARLTARFRGFHEGSIHDLSRFAGGTFDAVLCLGGPLSHVLDEKQRRTAVAELVRVAKPKAPIFVSVIGRLALLTGMLTRFPHELRHAQQHWQTGDYRPGVNGEGFTAAHWFLPEELRSLFERADVRVVEMAGLEGLSSHHAGESNELSKNKQRWRMWKEILLSTCTHPSVVGCSEHFLLVARKNG